jgi:hypothetical protein
VVLPSASLALVLPCSECQCQPLAATIAYQLVLSNSANCCADRMLLRSASVPLLSYHAVKANARLLPGWSSNDESCPCAQGFAEFVLLRSASAALLSYHAVKANARLYRPNHHLTSSAPPIAHGFIECVGLRSAFCLVYTWICMRVEVNAKL